MSRLCSPLQPRRPGSPLRVLAIGRISTEHQNLANIDASYRYVEDWLRTVYQGPLEIRHLGERASGLLVDRATIREAEDLIATAEWDLVIAEDLSRIFRNPRHQYNFVQDAVDSETRVICIGDNLDTADENWEIMMGAATLRHGTAIPDIRRRVRRTATHAFHGGGMVLKVRFGYRKLTREEAASGEFGPRGLRLAKRPELSPVIREMMDRIIRGEHYTAVAEWLRAEGTENPPYAGSWTGRLVNELLADPILSGTRSFRRTTYRPVYRTGQYRRQRNPAPETESCPELAHFTPAEHEKLLRVMDERRKSYGRRSGSEHPRQHLPRSRVLWPAQHARCAICGSLMYQCGEHWLKCRQAMGQGAQKCWNRVQVRCDTARERVLSWLVQLEGESGAARQVLLDAVWSEHIQTTRQKGGREVQSQRELVDFERQAANLTAAIAQGGSLQPLLDRLAEVQNSLATAREQLAARDAARASPAPEISREQVEEQLPALVLSLASTSYEFGAILRQLCPTFLVQPVQALDRPTVRPRGKLVLSVPAPQRDSRQSAGELRASIDLFEWPAHMRSIERCFARRIAEPQLSLREIGSRLGLNYMTVKRAMDYAALMRSAGLAEPYRELMTPPERGSRWRSRRLRNGTT